MSSPLRYVHALVPSAALRPSTVPVPPPPSGSAPPRPTATPPSTKAAWKPFSVQAVLRLLRETPTVTGSISEPKVRTAVPASAPAKYSSPSSWPAGRAIRVVHSRWPESAAMAVSSTRCRSGVVPEPGSVMVNAASRARFPPTSTRRGAAMSSMPKTTRSMGCPSGFTLHSCLPSSAFTARASPSETAYAVVPSSRPDHCPWPTSCPSPSWNLSGGSYVLAATGALAPPAVGTRSVVGAVTGSLPPPPQAVSRHSASPTGRTRRPLCFPGRMVNSPDSSPSCPL
ncbi:hypothetical protein ACGFZL_31040 [Streptomyces sp. NPDC048182]|uniref:hypothetical protein n=1 Tax=Streptomyces sp. NPDC048182 TaxID=3365507 RepID=UPI0037174292